MPAESADDQGCAYIVETGPGGSAQRCRAPLRPGSSYCAEHHALCYLKEGSAAEALRLLQDEALARAVGGRQGRSAVRPSPAFLRRLARAARVSSRPNGSCFVQEGKRP